MPSRSEFPRRPLLGHSCIFPGGQYPSLPILSPSPRAGSLLAHSKENHPFGRQKQPFGGCHLTSSALDSKMLASVRAGLTSLAPFRKEKCFETNTYGVGSSGTYGSDDGGDVRTRYGESFRR